MLVCEELTQSYITVDPPRDVLQPVQTPVEVMYFLYFRSTSETLLMTKFMAVRLKLFNKTSAYVYDVKANKQILVCN